MTTLRKPSSGNPDCIDWTLEMKDDFPASEKEDLLWQMSHELVHLLGAAHAPTGMTITHMLWQLSHQPQYLDPLRHEAQNAISRFGFTGKIVDHLPFLDSFITETNRLFPNNKLGLPRLVSGSDFTFHDGLTVPAGTRIAFPIQEFLRDQEIFDNPDRFDSFRFVHLKESDARTEEGVNTWRASHANKWNLAFGYGNHGCPGRFFAVRLIKMIFVKLLVDYNFQSDWPHDGIPPGLEMEGALIPNINARMEFTRRSRLAGAHG
ncbi:hypothetical protein Daus18300_012034 [Diaporthe australafricana]|uniref:Cytochrome P450 n=1 Tax=Diaporthe australafricana TaxID=127596 RepID=A0ABR3W438_9PEZI